MLSENIKRIRKEKGLSQEELAGKVYVVRQTVSKWEQGLSVPDSEMLIALSQALETPVSSLLGESMTKAEVDELDILAKKLEVINFKLAEENKQKRRRQHGLFIALALMILVISLALLFLKSPGTMAIRKQRFLGLLIIPLNGLLPALPLSLLFLRLLGSFGRENDPRFK